MSGSQTQNAALTTALAFHYQVLIGLDKCFSLEDGQSVWFEKDGDVSLISPHALESIQAEVKDYSAALTDHHENLWKTLKNWLAPDFNHAQYGVLVLHTTQAFGANTRLKNWNSLYTEQRLEVLKEIFAERTEDQLNAEKPSDVIKLQKTVMAADEVLLKNMLGKVTLFTQADNAQELEKQILSRPVGIPRNNLRSYLHGLIGFVYAQATQQSWSIKHQEFTEKCEELTALLCKKEFTFPIFSGYEASELEVELHQDRPFVQKITEIEHHEMVPDAVGNWLELQNSLLEQLDEYPLYKDKTITYQNQLVKKYKLAYSSAQLEAKDSIKSSKLLYNRTIGEQPLSMGNGTPPLEYKNGLIHDAMDDEERELKWRVEP
ncbi:adenylate cyclase [Chromohalobacter israelensis]|uniref:adenylate cyclase n=1 Tax=Chromohalobacter israelensis TaxID=141390 RepID=UPI001CC77F6C|nr:adenylate cyclase [Chromohalobacter salexigens]MBZ5876777.1 adenylate cyclase [Chromohalobacter salexigens]